jgi:hypothetical protein
MSLRAKRGNLLPIPEIALAGFVSLEMTERGIILSRSPDGHKPCREGVVL